MQLWILRHARARAALSDEWDRDRPLSEAGRQDAARLNQWLSRTTQAVPKKVLVSPATRTRQTASAVLAGFDAVAPILDERLWEATSEDLLAVVKQYAEDHDSLMLIGHNPGLEWLTGWLTGQRLALGLQPGVLVIVELSRPVQAASGRIRALVQPSDLT